MMGQRETGKYTQAPLSGLRNGPRLRAWAEQELQTHKRQGLAHVSWAMRVEHRRSAGSGARSERAYAHVAARDTNFTHTLPLRTEPGLR